MIDEEGLWKLKKYAKTITQTDHNTITVKLKFTNSMLKRENSIKKMNVKNDDARSLMKYNIANDVVIDKFFMENKELDAEFTNFVAHWESIMDKSFQVINPKKCRKGINADVKLLLKEEKWIRANVMENSERGRRLKLAWMQMQMS